MAERIRVLVALVPLLFLGAVYASTFVHVMLRDERFAFYACVHWGLAILGSCVLYWLL
jgi:hypothetical protein